MTDKRIDIVIAEFNALRAEMNNRTTIQATVVGTGVTAIGAAATFAIGEKGNPQLLLLIPVVAAVILFLFSNESSRIHELGDFIRDEQFDYLRRILNDNQMPSWKHHVAHRYREVGFASKFRDAPVDLALIVAGAAALYFAPFTAYRWILIAPLLLAALNHLWVGCKGASRAAKVRDEPRTIKEQ